LNRRFLSLGFFLLICYAASATSGLVNYPNITGWYQNLNKPDWTPPPSIFGPVLTLLYMLMAVAAWLVWDRLHGGAFPALRLFGYQLGLAVVWSLLFFGMRSPDTAAAAIIVLWLVICATMFAFLRIHRLAGILLAPHWIWVTFAAYLNVAIARNN
jgi:tryptophan-rich sensory protein